MKLSQTPASVTARFDDPHLIGYAGLVPVMRLAETAGLYKLVREHVKVPGDKGANPWLKTASLIAGMVAGADSIDEMDLVRHTGMDLLFTGVRAPSTLGSFLRAFTFGHSRQMDAVASRFLTGLDSHSGLLGVRDGHTPVMVDIDDTLVQVFGAKQGAAVGYTRTLGLDAALVTVSGEDFAPVIVANRLRKGSAASMRGSVRLIRDALAVVARSSLAARQVWARADSGFYSSLFCQAITKTGGWFSVAVRMTRPVRTAIAMIPDQAWTMIDYPDAQYDPESRQWISRAEVAETSYIAFASTTTPMPVRLIVHCIPDWQAEHKKTEGQNPLFTSWRFHGFITNVPTESWDTITVDKAHRQHAVIEQVNSALKDSALAHLPSGKFTANTVWLTLACMTFNLLRALATLTGDPHLSVAQPATLRHRIIAVPARIASSARRIILHLPLEWKWATSWMTMFTATRHYNLIA